MVSALPYEAKSSELSNWLVNFEVWTSAAFPDSNQENIRPEEIWVTVLIIKERDLGEIRQWLAERDFAGLIQKSYLRTS